MSLQIAAQHLASRGRGPDTQLVHMAPQEVAGLHALARAHGGSLTVNPDTGLPEAGFLSNILPMVIGAGLSIASGGTLTPLMAAGITGAGYGVATGSLSKGLMAGLGAFGGAGLAGGLTAAGAAGAAEAGAAGLGAMGPQTAAQLGTGFESAMAAQGITPTLGATGASMGAQTAGQLGAGFQADMAAQGIQPSAIQAQQAVMRAAPQTVTPMADRFAQAGRGFTNLGTEAGREAFMSKAGVDGGMGLMKYGYAAGLPMLMQEPKKLAEKEKLKPYEYSYSSGYNPNPDVGYTGAYTGERTYFDPRFVRTAAGGGLMDIGPVEAMSRANQPQMQPAYAQGGVSDMAVGPYTGAETFAEGGETKAVRPVEQDPYYTMSGQSGDAFKYLMGQTPASPKAPAPAFAAPAVAAAPVYEDRPGGEWVDDTSTKSYTFDPVTGTFTPVAAKVWRPFAPVSPVGDFVGGYGGSDGGYGGSDGGYGGMGGYAAADGVGLSGLGVGNIGSFGFGTTGTDTGTDGTGAGDGSSGGGGGMGNSGEGGGGPGEGGWARGGIASLAQGGQSHLGDYSDGGRMLRGPGDGVSDSIPATIGGKRPARLADGEFVVPARIVSELGNGSTEAGARKLYAMMDRVQKARGKTTGKNRVAVNSRAEKLLPA